MSWLYSLDLFGTAVFAIAGALAAGRKEMDLFGVSVLAVVTALGGGTLRDLILNQPVGWTEQTAYIWVAVVASIVTFYSARIRRIPTQVLLWSDALGLAVFTIVGAQKALLLGFSPTIAVIMGVMTGVFGGMIRDVLCGEVPLILRKEIYASAALLGALVFVGLYPWFGFEPWLIILAGGLTLSLRLASLYWHFSLPVLRMKE
jgi:uncharacterized membrane protein YeiH